MKKTTQDQILIALQEIKSALAELKQSVNALEGQGGKRTIPPRENPWTQSKIFKNKKVRDLTIKLFREGIAYNEIKERLFFELNFSTSRSAISRFYRRRLKENFL